MKNEEQLDVHLQMWTRVCEGDRHAFDELYMTFIQELFNYGLKINPDKELVKESIQALFVNIWNKKKQLNIDRSIKSYLFLSLRRSLIKSGKSNAFISIPGFAELLKGEAVHLQIDYREDPILHKQEKMKEAINCLTKRQKEAIFLKFYEGMNSEEIAGIMNLKVAAIYKLVSTGIKRMREFINTHS